VPNKHSSKTTNNALSILKAIGKENDVHVYPGAAEPLERPPLHAPSDIHGESGLDGTDLLPRPATPANRSVAAVDAAAAALRAEPPGTAWVVATGAMTNAATLFVRHPDLVDHVAGLSIMGGAVGATHTAAVMGEVAGVPRIGNSTPFAEFNIFADPEAAALLFHNPRLAAKMTMIPLDVSHLVLASKPVQDLLLYGPEGPREGVAAQGKGKTTLRTMLVELLNFFAKTYRYVTQRWTVFRALRGDGGCLGRRVVEPTDSGRIKTGKSTAWKRARRCTTPSPWPRC